MKKSKLKTGMRITQRNGDTAIVLLGTSNGDIVSCIGTKGTWSPLEEYNSDLTNKHGQEYDIVKVEDANCNMDYLHLYTSIWSL